MTSSRRRIETLAVQGFEKLNLIFCAPNVRLTGLLVIHKRLKKSFGLLMWTARFFWQLIVWLKCEGFRCHKIGDNVKDAIQHRDPIFCCLVFPDECLAKRTGNVS